MKHWWRLGLVATCLFVSFFLFDEFTAFQQWVLAFLGCIIYLLTLGDMFDET